MFPYLYLNIYRSQDPSPYGASFLSCSVLANTFEFIKIVLGKSILI